MSTPSGPMRVVFQGTGVRDNSGSKSHDSHPIIYDRQPSQRLRTHAPGNGILVPLVIFPEETVIAFPDQPITTNINSSNPHVRQPPDVNTAPHLVTTDVRQSPDSQMYLLQNSSSVNVLHRSVEKDVPINRQSSSLPAGATSKDVSRIDSSPPTEQNQSNQRLESDNSPNIAPRNRRLRMARPPIAHPTAVAKPPSQSDALPRDSSGVTPSDSNQALVQSTVNGQALLKAMSNQTSLRAAAGEPISSENADNTTANDQFQTTLIDVSNIKATKDLADEVAAKRLSAPSFSTRTSPWQPTNTAVIRDPDINSEKEQEEATRRELEDPVTPNSTQNTASPVAKKKIISPTEKLANEQQQEAMGAIISRHGRRRSSNSALPPLSSLGKLAKKPTNVEKSKHKNVQNMSLQDVQDGTDETLMVKAHTASNDGGGVPANEKMVVRASIEGTKTVPKSAREAQKLVVSDGNTLKPQAPNSAFNNNSFSLEAAPAHLVQESIRNRDELSEKVNNLYKSNPKSNFSKNGDQLRKPANSSSASEDPTPKYSSTLENLYPEKERYLERIASKEKNKQVSTDTMLRVQFSDPNESVKKRGSEPAAPESSSPLETNLTAERASTKVLSAVQGSNTLVNERQTTPNITLKPTVKTEARVTGENKVSLSNKECSTHELSVPDSNCNEDLRNENASNGRDKATLNTMSNVKSPNRSEAQRADSGRENAYRITLTNPLPVDNHSEPSRSATDSNEGATATSVTLKRTKRPQADQPLMVVFKHLIKTVVTYNQKHSFRGRQFVEDRKSYLREILQKVGERGKSEAEPALLPHEVRSTPKSFTQPEEVAQNDVNSQSRRARSSSDTSTKSDVRDKARGSSSKVRIQNNSDSSSAKFETNLVKTVRSIDEPNDSPRTQGLRRVSEGRREENNWDPRTTESTSATPRTKSNLDRALELIRSLDTKFVEWKKDAASMLDGMCQVSAVLGPEERDELFDKISDQELLTWLLNIGKCTATVDTFWPILANNLLAMRGAQSPREKEKSKQTCLKHINVFVYLMKWCDSVFYVIAQRCETYAADKRKELGKFKTQISKFLDSSENDKFGNVLGRLRKIRNRLKQAVASNHVAVFKAAERFRVEFEKMNDSATELSGVVSKLDDQEPSSTLSEARSNRDQSRRSSSTASENPSQSVQKIHGVAESQTDGQRARREIPALTVNRRLPPRESDACLKDGIELPTIKGTSLKRKHAHSGAEINSENAREGGRDNRPSKRRVTESSVGRPSIDDPHQVNRLSAGPTGQIHEHHRSKEAIVNANRDNRNNDKDQRIRQSQENGSATNRAISVRNREQETRTNETKRSRQFENSSDLPPIPRVNVNNGGGSKNSKGNSRGLIRSGGDSDRKIESGKELLSPHDGNPRKIISNQAEANLPNNSKNFSRLERNFESKKKRLSAKQAQSNGDKRNGLRSLERKTHGEESNRKRTGKDGSAYHGFKSQGLQASVNVGTSRTDSGLRRSNERGSLSANQSNTERFNLDVPVSGTGPTIERRSIDQNIRELNRHDNTDVRTSGSRSMPSRPFSSENLTKIGSVRNFSNAAPNECAPKQVTSILKEPKKEHITGGGSARKHEKRQRKVQFKSILVSGAASQDRSKDELNSLFIHGYDVLGEQVPLQKEAVEERVKLISRGMLGAIHGLITRAIENMKREVEGAPPITSDRMRLPYAPTSVRYWSRQFNVSIPEGPPSTSQNSNARSIGSGIGLGLRSAPAPASAAMGAGQSHQQQLHRQNTLQHQLGQQSQQNQHPHHQPHLPQEDAYIHGHPTYTHTQQNPPNQQFAGQNVHIEHNGNYQHSPRQ